MTVAGAQPDCGTGGDDGVRPERRRSDQTAVRRFARAASSGCPARTRRPVVTLVRPGPQCEEGDEPDQTGGQRHRDTVPGHCELTEQLHAQHHPTITAAISGRNGSPVR